jgi:hypothetical protein
MRLNNKLLIGSLITIVVLLLGGIGACIAEPQYSFVTNDIAQHISFFASNLDDLGKKHFFQYHWDGSGWPTGKPKGPKIPYMLPELIKAHPSNLVFLCEGEKDADALPPPLRAAQGR